MCEAHGIKPTLLGHVTKGKLVVDDKHFGFGGTAGVLRQRPGGNLDRRLMWKELAKHAGGVALAWVVVLVGTFFCCGCTANLLHSARFLTSLAWRGWTPSTPWRPSGWRGVAGPFTSPQEPPVRWWNNTLPRAAVKVGRNILLTTHRITPPDEAVSYQEGRCQARGAHFDHPRLPNFGGGGAQPAAGGQGHPPRAQGQNAGFRNALPKGSELVLWQGCWLDDARVPWLSGLSLQDAAAVLARRKLALGHVGYAPDVLTARDSANAVVASQDIVPSETPYVAEGTAVDLYFDLR